MIKNLYHLAVAFVTLVLACVLWVAIQFLPFFAASLLVKWGSGFADFELSWVQSAGVVMTVVGITIAVISTIPKQAEKLTHEERNVLSILRAAKDRASQAGNNRQCKQDAAK